MWVWYQGHFIARGEIEKLQREPIGDTHIIKLIECPRRDCIESVSILSDVSKAADLVIEEATRAFIVHQHQTVEELLQNGA